MSERPILKTPEEIEIMRAAGALVAQAMRMISTMIQPGITTLMLDQEVEAFFRKNDGVPAFLGYPSPSPKVAPFSGTICASINEEVVHGIPSADRVLRDGDIISVDMGVKLNGFFGDAAWTFPVGMVGRKVRRLLDVGRECLEKAIVVMHPGVKLARIGREVQQHAEDNRFSVVRQFVGHGIGRRMHEPPQVPNYVSRAFGDIVLDTGAVVAVEPMVNQGCAEVDVLADGWTVVTCDRKLSVHFEHSIAIGPNGPIVLTAW